MIKSTKEKIVRENPHNGKGSIEVYEILSSKDMGDNVKVFSKVIVKPNSIIGYHKHLGESEAYYVTKGSGIFIDEKENRIPVSEGDVCLINSGESHGMENNTNEDMEMIALVYPSE